MPQWANQETFLKETRVKHVEAGGPGLGPRAKIDVMGCGTEIQVYLTGGLGNQMFQYATGLAVSVRSGGELSVDPWSGFVRDRQYRRRYELGRLPARAKMVDVKKRLAIWLYRLETRFRPPGPALVMKRPYGTFIVEPERTYVAAVTKLSLRSRVWLVGYWQSPRYFEEQADLVRAELTPPRPWNRRFTELGDSLRQQESVAVGVRLYEESLNPEAHSRDGRMKTVEDVNGAIARVRASCRRARFVVFCSHRAPFLEGLNLPEGTLFATPEEGFADSIDILWLLTQCRHHIFTNSSYYWWGAWLSSGAKDRPMEPRLILAADNFVNRDSLCLSWQTF